MNLRSSPTVTPPPPSRYLIVKNFMSLLDCVFIHIKTISKNLIEIINENLLSFPWNSEIPVHFSPTFFRDELNQTFIIQLQDISENGVLLQYNIQRKFKISIV